MSLHETCAGLNDGASLFEPKAANWESAALVHRRGKLWQRWDVSGSVAASLASAPSAGGQITPADTKGFPVSQIII